MRTYDWYFFEKLYSVVECEEIVEICKKNKSLHRVDIHGPEKNVNTIIVDAKALKHKLDKLFEISYEANNLFFGYELFKDALPGIAFNTYENEKNEYPYHIDVNASGTMSDLKLTVLLNLSLKPYKGGDFYMFLGQDFKIEKINEPGNVLIFPSFLYHKVSPVIEGQRITLATWLQGPNFK